MIKQFRLLLVVLMLLPAMLMAQKQYKYTTFPNDPLGARIYKLDNGLTVYMSVYKDAPKIQTLVGVRVGSKNDPKETTGLAHYLEHMMFKGTPSFGTLNWQAERPQIAKIDSLFEVYRNEVAPDRRKAIYHAIDSISFVASTFAIPNEYDKLMSAIGSDGTNAYTSNDYTVYVENIPSNQIRPWAEIQTDRFQNLVLRLFHTELETVYEEKNMSLTKDSRKANEAMLKALFPNHPYGQQTTLGETEHLKNPSMKNIREFYSKYYVPNNMAISMSGDFNPDEAIRIIDATFGKLKPSPVTPLTFAAEKPLTSPVTVDVTGLEAENITMAYRFDGASSSDVIMVELIDNILSNGKAGLIDLNVNQKMLTQSAGSSVYGLTDYSAFILSGKNKSGQTLDQVKDILLQQVDLLKKGDFPDGVIEASINNLKLQRMKSYENNNNRATAMLGCFLDGTPYEKLVNYLDRLGKITKADVVKFANERFGNNYVVVYKRQGNPTDVAKVEKPAITPVQINREEESKLLTDIKAEVKAAKQIEPVFIDYNKDITHLVTKSNIPVLYRKNSENGTFMLAYHFKMGSNHDKVLNIAAKYLNYLGTSKNSAEQLKKEFYKLACSFNVQSTSDETYVFVNGLAQNAWSALSLMEQVLNNAKADTVAYRLFVNNILKQRKDAKANQQSNISVLNSYATYGPLNPQTNILSEAELKAMKPEVLVAKIKSLLGIEHTILFYGPQSEKEVLDQLEKSHITPKLLAKGPTETSMDPLETTTNKVIFAHYQAKQAYLRTASRSIAYDSNVEPVASLYNNYFGGGMNAIVFQELREKRGLAYTAWAFYTTPTSPDKWFLNNSFIATQNDKLFDATDAFNDLFNNMPTSEGAFALTKESVISSIRTERITKDNILWSYLKAQKMKQTTDVRKSLFEKVQKLSLADVVNFNSTYIKNKPKTYIILGNEAEMDFNKITQKYGPVTKLSQEAIFGY